MSDLPEQLSVLKEGVSLSVSKDYVQFVSMTEGETPTSVEIAQKVQCLFDTDVSPEEKKKALVLLANQGTADACLTIRRFVETADSELMEWGILALEQCWLSVESDLFGRSAGMIVSGLGGEGERIRYFFAVQAKETIELTAHQEMIERSFRMVCKSFDSVLESIKIYPDYATLLVLISQDVAVGGVIEEGIAESNRAGDWVEEHYFVTNNQIPETEELLSHLGRFAEK